MPPFAGAVSAFATPQYGNLKYVFKSTRHGAFFPLWHYNAHIYKVVIPVELTRPSPSSSRAGSAPPEELIIRQVLDLRIFERLSHPPRATKLRSKNWSRCGARLFFLNRVLTLSEISPAVLTLLMSGEMTITMIHVERT